MLNRRLRRFALAGPAAALLALLQLEAGMARAIEHDFSGPHSNVLSNVNWKGRLSCWTSLDSLFQTTGGLAIPLMIHFTPVDPFVPEPILGFGCYIPVFEANVVRVSESKAELRLPDGDRIMLKLNPKAESGQGEEFISLDKRWTCHAAGDDFKADRTDGLSLQFRKGLLSQLKTDAETLFWRRNKDSIVVEDSKSKMIARASLGADGLAKQLSILQGTGSMLSYDVTSADFPLYATGPGGVRLPVSILKTLGGIKDSDDNEWRFLHKVSEGENSELVLVSSPSTGAENSNTVTYNNETKKVTKDSLSDYSLLIEKAGKLDFKRKFSDGTSESFQFDPKSFIMRQGDRAGKIREKRYVGAEGPAYGKVARYIEVTASDSSVLEDIKFSYDKLGKELRRTMMVDTPGGKPALFAFFSSKLSDGQPLVYNLEDDLVIKIQRVPNDAGDLLVSIYSGKKQTDLKLDGNDQFSALNPSTAK